MFLYQYDGKAWANPQLLKNGTLRALPPAEIAALPWHLTAIFTRMPHRICLHFPTECHDEEQYSDFRKKHIPYAGGLKIFLDRSYTQENMLALAMGWHRRLGQTSRLSTLEPGLLIVLSKLSFD